MPKNTENIADFPKIVPIFPLSEIILLPKGQIKLNIFESKQGFRTMGAYFYIVTKKACQELVDNAWPMDLQTDAYIHHLAKQNKIMLEYFPTVKHIFTKKEGSSIQDKCIKYITWGLSTLVYKIPPRLSNTNILN